MNDVLVVVTCGQWAAPTRDTIPVCAGVSACRRIIGLVSTTNLQAFAKTACADRAPPGATQGPTDVWGKASLPPWNDATAQGSLRGCLV